MSLKGGWFEITAFSSKILNFSSIVQKYILTICLSKLDSNIGCIKNITFEISIRKWFIKM